MMNNSFGGNSSPTADPARAKYRPLMKNLHVEIPASCGDQVDQVLGSAASYRTVHKADGLISLKKQHAAAARNLDLDLNNNLAHLSLANGQYFKQQQPPYSPPSAFTAYKQPGIKTSISNFKLSGATTTDPYRYRNPAAKQQQQVSPYDDDDESTCLVCDRRSTTILCKNCGHDWTGRVRTKCQAHPSTVYLMDLEACTKCASKDIKELN